MCDAKHCQHEPDDLCSCRPVQSGDSFRMALHLAENMTDVDWHLTYQTLETINPYRMCLIGKCRICGGRLCIEQKSFGIVTTDDFLAAAYRHLYQFRHNLGQPLRDKEFRVKFVEMFREDDRAFVQEWLSWPENQSVHTMYRRSVKKAYTIVHTWADAGKADFPFPEGKGTYMDLDMAREEMARMVEQEKKAMQFPFDKELYREDYSDNFWEANCDGYAAGWFIRYDIIESPLHMETEKGE